MKRALQIILGVSLFGVLFSGYLSYGELFATPAEPACAPVGEPGTVLGYPACVYGLFMYLAIAVVAAVGLTRRSSSEVRGRALGAVI